jgi:IclR family pca regulon transcriptional regulator
MGRVLLAHRTPEEIARYLSSVDLKPLTRRTVTDAERLEGILNGVRTQGFAIVDQELEDGVRSLAAPLHGAAGAVVAAINVSAHASRVTMDTLRKDLLPHLLASAAKIDADLQSLGGQTTPPSPPTPRST